MVGALMAFNPTLVRSWPRGSTNILWNAFRNGVLSIPNATETAVINYTSENNPVGAGDATTGRFAFPEPGVYAMCCSGQWAANATGYRQLVLRALGVGAESSVWPSIGAGAVTIQTVSGIYFVTAAAVAAARFVEVGAIQTSTIALNIDQVAFRVVKISDWPPA